LRLFAQQGSGLGVVAAVLFLAPFAVGATDPVDTLVSRMSMEEKAGQMVLVYHSPYHFLREHGVGGVLIMQDMLRRPDQLRAELDSVQRLLPVPLLVTVDQEGGSVNRLSVIKKWKGLPAAREFAHWPADSISRFWTEVGQELHGLGINTNLAPVLDPSRNAAGNPTFMAVKLRSFGDGPEQILPAAVAFADAFAAAGTQCVAKHFPGYDAETNSDHDIAISTADSAWLAASVDVFRRMRPHIDGVMMSSIEYLSISREPAVLSPAMVSWAREALGDVVIMTDDLWGTALRSHMLPGATVHPVDYPDSAFARLVERAVKAGNDMLMITFPRKVPLMIQTIVGLARQDPAVAAHVDNAARRIVRSKYQLGMLNGRLAAVRPTQP
jgi:beta-N-acetylhexosaminidase